MQLPDVDDLVLIDHFVNRKKLSDQTGINYQTLSGKIRRRKQGHSPKLSLEQKELLREYLIDLHDKITFILNH